MKLTNPGVLLIGLALTAQAQQIRTHRPFGTLREQADIQQQWLDKRMATVLPALMRKHGVEFWVVPMREYNEDPVFTSIVSPTTFAARRRTIYVFHDKCSRLSALGPRRADTTTAERREHLSWNT